MGTRRFVWALICCTLLCSICFSTAYPQDCKKCGPRTIMCYDFDMLVKKPANTKDTNWQQLLKISDGYVRQLLNTVDRQCITIMPVRFPSIMEEGDQPSDKKFTLGPSLGPTANFDYVMFGDVRGSEGKYKATIDLVTGDTRESVATRTTTFAKASEAAWIGQSLALNLGATDRGSKPLKQLIDEWEKQKRLEDPRIALNAKVVWVDPPKRIEAGEPVILNARLVDCDGYKLPKRKLTVDTADGSIEPKDIKTDRDGNAMIVFTPRKEGVASLDVIHEFRRPSERVGSIVATDTCSIQVGDTADKLDASLTIKSQAILQSGNPDEDGYEKQVLDWTITADLVLANYGGKAMSMAKDTKQWDLCAEGTGNCSVADGSNYTDTRVLGQPEPPSSPVNVTVKENKWVRQDGKMKHVFQMSTQNKLRDGRVFLHIAFMPPAVTGPRADAQGAGLVHKYRLVIESGSENFGHQGPNPQAAKRWDEAEQKWIDCAGDIHISCTNWAALSDTRYEANTEDRQIMYAVIDDAKGLEEYLADPKGSKEFHTTASLFVKANGTKEDHAITLTLSPHVDKKSQQ